MRNLKDGLPEKLPSVSLRRVANIYDDFAPVLWEVGKVCALHDGKGDTVGFYLRDDSNRRYREDLPVEIFNHQLKQLNPKSEAGLVSFMSEYGMLFNSWPGAIEEVAQYCRFVNVRKWGTHSMTAIDAAIQQLRSFFSAGSHTSEGRFETYKLWEAEYEAMKQWVGTDWDGYEHKLFLISALEVQENIEVINMLVDLAKAASRSDSEEAIAAYIGIDCSGLFDEILYRDQVLNGLLHVYQPKVGFVYTVDGVEGSPTYYCDLLDIHEFDGSMAASFMNAVALQIRDFNIKLSDARQCSECGEIFIAKQTAKPSSRPHSDSKFCCDKCKNRFTQRKHRQTPGYRLKQDQKRRIAKGPDVCHTQTR